MKTGLAAWHYPHRKIHENVTYFLQSGFDYVSLNGPGVLAALNDPEAREALTRAVAEQPITLHFPMPNSHKEEDVAVFRKGIDTVAAWQAETGAIDILSFDVYGGVRGNASPYVRYAMERVGTRTAVEDYGLNDAELRDLASLEGEEKFGYLLDIGHMFIRFNGKNTSGATLFTQSALEANEATTEGFVRTLRAKTFPVFEMHLHNNDGEHDTHRFLPDGALDMAAFAEALRTVGYDGYLTIESAPGYQFPCYGAEADAGILRDLALWRSLMK